MLSQIDSEELIALVKNEGHFTQKFPNFKSRLSQQEMLRNVLEAYEKEKIALIEAATGTGKSIAYLLPALYWATKHGERTVISTNTIALQEQLIKKDLPALLNLLGVKTKVALAKGMHNYLCLRKMHDIESEKNFLKEEEQWEIEEIQIKLEDAVDGSKSDIGAKCSPSCWDRVAAESESCTHMRCPHYKNCFFFKAREVAKEANIVVANHHLLFADLKARQESNNYTDDCILPFFSRLIIDEAHHLEDVAKEYFASRVSKRGLFRLFNRLISEKIGGGKLRALHQKIGEVILAKDKEINALMSVLELDLAIEKRELVAHIDRLFMEISSFVQEMGEFEKVRFKTHHQLQPKWTEIQTMATNVLFHGKRWVESVHARLKQIEENSVLEGKCEGLIADTKALLKKIEGHFSTLYEFVFKQEIEGQVKWIESGPTNVHLVCATIDVSQLVKECLFDKMKTSVLTSATLATNGEFRFIKEVLGIVEANEKIYTSPFDYENRTLFCVPIDMLQPDDEGYLGHASDLIFQAVQASEGHAFVLFTSYESLRFSQERLQKRFQEKGYPLLCQGDEGSGALLKKFSAQKNSVLFGTDSFWEGVDVVGDQLRCVIIVKLPFLVPSDPFFQAKSEKMKSQGKSPFFDYSLPLAAMKFKQGFGRLIRSETDRGCVICLDPRIATKAYGKVILNTLPKAKRVFEPRVQMNEKVREFFKGW